MTVPKVKFRLLTVSMLAVLFLSVFVGVWQIKPAQATDSSFGYPTIGSLECYQGSNKKMVSKFTLPVDGQIFQIGAYMEADDANVIGIVYADNGVEPSTRLGYTSSHQVDSGYAWELFTFTTNVSGTAGVYYIGFCADWSPRIKYNTGGSTNQSTYNSDEPASPDDPFGASIESWDVILSVFANYTVGDVPSSVVAGSHFGMNDTFKGEGCNIYSDWVSTGCNLEYGIFGSNLSGTFTNSSATALSGTSSWFNKSITLPNVYQDVVQCQIWVNNTAGNNTTTGLFNIHIDQRNYGVTAISGYYKHIQVAVDLASTYGENLTKIPEGTFNFSVLADNDLWSTDVAVSIPAGINLYGAPVSLYPNGSVIQWKTSLQMPYEYATSGPDNQPIWFMWTLNESDLSLTVEVKNLELVGYRYFNSASSTQYCGVAIYNCAWGDTVTTGMQNIHVHHCNFQDMCGSAISMQPLESSNHNRRPVSGVIDHNRLVNTIGFGIGDPDEWNDRNLTYGIAIGRWACDVWDTNLSNVLGQYTNYTVIIENNYFSKWRHCVAINHGIHVILRFNIVEADYGSASFDSHGSYADGSYPDAVGTRCTEIYNNTFKDPDPRYQPGSTWCVNFRGGCGVIYNNTAVGYYDFVRLQNDAGNYAPYSPQCHINNTYIWDNSFDGGGQLAKNVYDSILNVNHYLRAPTQGQDNFTYVPYVYPDPIMESGLRGFTVTVTITLPTNTTYTSSSISLSLSASGGTIDTIWWNCKKGTSWIYPSNQTYTTPTSMTGLADGTYALYGWANNTDGNSDEETVTFSVAIPANPVHTEPYNPPYNPPSQETPSENNDTSAVGESSFQVPVNVTMPMIIFVCVLMVVVYSAYEKDTVKSVGKAWKKSRKKLWD
jgi:hypothetical protein